MTDAGSIIYLGVCIAMVLMAIGFLIGYEFGLRSGERIGADHALALAYGDSLENHKEWLNALIDARARKEKRNV